MKTIERNVLVLAYLGDSIYEVFVRNYLIHQKIEKVKDLQASAVSFVSAKGQAKILKNWMEEKLLSKEEQELVLRARNHKGTRHPKNTDILTYKYATAFEALIGFWYLEKNFDRLKQMMERVLGESVCTYMEKM